MKKFLIPVTLFTLIFSSCKTSQLESYQDDVYKSPTEEKRLARIAAAEQAKKEAEQKQKQEADALAQKAKDDANPYYQDPQYNTDDYYDYKYASQLRRFNNPINGAGYYNNYYTNSYMYNQNPAMYGSSIYSSYNYNMPSNQFYGYSSGLSLMFGTGNYYNNSYGGYNPYYGSYNPYYSNNFYGYGYGMYGSYNPYSYGYNPYAYNPYNPYGCGMGYYSPYGMGYNSGFYNGYNMGYFNSYDPNSSYSTATYGPRGSNGGGNSMRQSYAGMAVPTENGARTQFINDVTHKQDVTPQFVEVPHKVNQASTNNNFSNTGNGSFNNGQAISSNPNSVNSGGGRGTTLNSGNGSNTNASNENTGFWPKIFGGNNTYEPSRGNTSNSGSGDPGRPNSYNNSGLNTNESISNNPNLGTSNPGRGGTYKNTTEPSNNNPSKGKTTFENNNSFFDNSGNSGRSGNGGFNNSGGGNFGGGSGGGRGGSGGGSNHPR